MFGNLEHGEISKLIEIIGGLDIVKDIVSEKSKIRIIKSDMRDVLLTPIGELGLAGWLEKRFFNIGWTHVLDIVIIEEEKLGNYKDIGDKEVREVKNALFEIGYTEKLGCPPFKKWTDAKESLERA